MESANTEYPKEITFTGPDINGLTPEAKEFIRKVKEGLKITMSAENVIQFRYPADIIREIRTVNVDNIIYRIDIYPHGLCFFPNVPWKREFMRNRWIKGKCTHEKGLLTIEYPPLP